MWVKSLPKSLATKLHRHRGDFQEVKLIKVAFGSHKNWPEIPVAKYYSESKYCSSCPGGLTEYWNKKAQFSEHYRMHCHNNVSS